ncbi:MAG: helix-turn-helix domain-containing protein [Pseudomonadota bacterium]
MSYSEAEPAIDLADYVLDFWQIAVRDSADVVPSQLYATDLLRIRFMIFDDRLLALLYGPSTSAHRKGLYLGDQVSFGATILPTAARHLFGHDVADFRDLRINLGVVWPETEALAAQIWQADFSQRVALLSRALRQRLADATRASGNFLDAYAQLSFCHGETNIGDISRRVGVSHRTLNRLFHAHVGMSPKECARVLRLHKRLDTLRGRGLPDDAVEGFADQSHWIREFKSLVGLSPHRYFSDLQSLHQMEHSYWTGTALSHYMKPPAAVIRFPDWQARNHARKKGTFNRDV